MVEHIKKVKVKDLETSITKHTIKEKKISKDICWNDLPEGFLSIIPKEYYENEVEVIKNGRNKKTQSEVFKFMNGRYVLKQLGLNLQATDLREIFYTIRLVMEGKMPVGAKGIQVVVTDYCRKLGKKFGYKYWAYARDYLNIKSKETIIIYDAKMNTELLSSKNLKDYAKTPFFLIICEKEEPLRATMEEMIRRGYKKGFYGVVLGGKSTTYNIKLLIDLSKIRNFYAFVMHDLDTSGIHILLDMVKWFPCESIGINPEMLDFVGVKFDDANEDYKAEVINFEKMFRKKLNLSEKEKNMYRKWIKACQKKRFEVNSLTSLRLKENINVSKARDFCDYLISKLKDPNRVWDLNRYDEPTYDKPELSYIDINKPQFVEKVEDKIDKNIKDINDKLKDLTDKIEKKQEEIKEGAYEELEDYLKLKKVEDDNDWKKLIEDKVNKMSGNNNTFHKQLHQRSKRVHKKILRKNRNYKGVKVVKNIVNIINNQTNELDELTDNQTDILEKMAKNQSRMCKGFIRATPEYKEVKKELKENEKRFTETNFKDYILELQKELTKMFKEIIETIEHEV